MIFEAGIDVSVVIPCLNEARTVGRCIDKAFISLRDLSVRCEIIVADNGSTDESATIARSHGSRVVSAISRGYGSALKAGIAAARGQFVVIGDADDSYDFGNLEPFIQRLRMGDDLVVGNRFRGGIKVGAMPWLHRYIGNPALSGLVNLLFRTPVSDTQCGLRAFRRESYLRWRMTSPGMEFASEMIVKATLNGDHISEVPIVLYPDGRGRSSHLRSFRDGWRHLRLLIVLCPAYLYLMPALLLLGSAIAGIAYSSICKRNYLTQWIAPASGLAAVLAWQAFWLWVSAVELGCRGGLVPTSYVARRILQAATLGSTIVSGVVLICIGLVWILWCLERDLESANTIWWGAITVAIGGQTIFNGFALFMIRVFECDDKASIGQYRDQHFCISSGLIWSPPTE